MIRNEDVEELRYRLVFYRHVKICAAFLRDRLDEQPFLPGATKKPLRERQTMQMEIGEEL